MTTAFMSYCEGYLFGQRFKKRCNFLSKVINQVHFVDTCAGKVTWVENAACYINNIYRNALE